MEEKLKEKLKVTDSKGVEISFKNEDELIEALVSSRLSKDTIIENADFSGKSFQEDEDSVHYRYRRRFSRINAIVGNFKNCKFNDAKSFMNMCIVAEDCDFSNFYLERATLQINAKHCNFNNMEFLESNLKGNIDNSTFVNTEFYKSDISGKISNSEFKVNWYRLSVARRYDLIMENVDFGEDPIESEHFEAYENKRFSERTQVFLINPKMNEASLNEIKQKYPYVLDGNSFKENLLKTIEEIKEKEKKVKERYAFLESLGEGEFEEEERLRYLDWIKREDYPDKYYHPATRDKARLEVLNIIRNEESGYLGNFYFGFGDVLDKKKYLHLFAEKSLKESLTGATEKILEKESNNSIVENPFKSQDFEK